MLSVSSVVAVILGIGECSYSSSTARQLIVTAERWMIYERGAELRVDLFGEGAGNSAKLHATILPLALLHCLCRIPFLVDDV